MGFWDTVRDWFAAESAEGRDLVEHLEAEWSADLDQREAELNAGPEQRLEQLQDDIAANDSAFDEIRSRIDGDAASEQEPDTDS